MTSSRRGFSILRSWKTFNSELWLIRNPLGGPTVRIADVSERKRRLVLGDGVELDLRGATFDEVPPEELPFNTRDAVRFLLIRLAGGSEVLLAELTPTAGFDRIM